MADDETTATANPSESDETTPTPEAASGDAAVATPADDGKLKQSVEISDIGPCKKHVKITVDRDAIDERFKEKFDELIKDRTAPVPGFRPGKAPRKYIERKFKPAVAEDVRREVLMASLQQLAEDSNLRRWRRPNWTRINSRSPTMVPSSMNSTSKSDRTSNCPNIRA